MRVAVPPAAVASVRTRVRRRRSSRITGQPALNIPRVDLLTPHQAGEGLALYATLLVGQPIEAEARGIEKIGFADARFERRVGVGERGGMAKRREAEEKCLGQTWRDVQDVVSGGLGARLVRIYSVTCVMEDIIVDTVFDEPRVVGNTP